MKYEYLLLLLIPLVVVYLIIKPRIIIKNIIKKLQDAQISNISYKHLIFKMQIKDQEYNVKVITNTKNKDLQINNFETWMIIGHGKEKQVKYMDIFMRLPGKKIVLLKDKATKIKKVINESEMIIATYQTNIYDTYVYNADNFDKLF